MDRPLAWRVARQDVHENRDHAFFPISIRRKILHEELMSVQ